MRDTTRHADLDRIRQALLVSTVLVALAAGAAPAVAADLSGSTAGGALRGATLSGGSNAPVGPGLGLVGDGGMERLGMDWRGRVALGGGGLAATPIWRGESWSIGASRIPEATRPDGGEVSSGLLGAARFLDTGLHAEWSVGPVRLDGGLRAGMGGELGVAYMRGLTPSTGLVIGGGVNWTGDEVAATDFGVTPSTFGRFTADNGRSDIGGNVALFYRPGGAWYGALNMEVDRALGATDRGTATETDSRLFFGLIVGYSF